MIMANEPAFERARAILEKDPSASELLSVAACAELTVGVLPTPLRRDSAACGCSDEAGPFELRDLP
jgi:hypothetical protein